MTARCATPIRHGPNKGQTATGTNAGYCRHLYAGEPACPPCLAAHTALVKATQQRVPRPQTTQPSAEKKPKKPNSFTYGGQLVTCKGCGARGVANKGIVGRARTIPACVNCKDAA